MATAKKVAAKKATEYDESNVQSHQGLPSIRNKPTWFIGDLDIGAWTIVREAADNAVDEGLAGRNTICYIHIDDKKGHWIADYGQGIPVGNIPVVDPITHKTHQVPALKAIVSLLSTSGKFNDKAYKVSRGAHGAGIKCSNALSARFQVWTFYRNQWYTLAYEKGKEVQAITKIKRGPKLPNGQTPKKGTVVFIKPDTTILKLPIDMKLVISWARISAYMTPKLKVLVENGSKKAVYVYPNGPVDYLTERIAKLQATELGKPFVYHSELVDIAIGFTDHSESEVRLFTNGLHNTVGGFHDSASSGALFDGLAAYLPKQRVTKKKNKERGLGPSDFKEGLIGLVNVKLSAPLFSSQTKEKLVDKRAGKPLRDILAKAYTEFFATHKSLAKQLIARAQQYKELKGQFKASLTVMKALNNIKRQGMPSKFAGANKARPEDRETFLVEGESAGGTAKQARDPNYQEVLPAKGKMMNAEKGGAKALESEEVINILAAIGYEPKASDPLAKVRTGKIILLSDPDPDGFHINLLELTLIHKYMPSLFKRGMIYVCDAPRYCTTEGKLYTGKTLDEVKAKAPKGARITHLKGWGEASVETLAQAAFDPQTRKLIQIQPETDKAGRLQFVKLMSEDTGYRRKLLGLGAELET